MTFISQMFLKKLENKEIELENIPARWQQEILESFPAENVIKNGDESN